MAQRILCPTDLTTHSKDGLTYAFSLARTNRAELMAFHVTSFPNLWQYPCELDAYYQWEEILSRFTMSQLLGEAERKTRNFVCENFKVESDGVAWKAIAALGSVAEEIVAAGIRENVDLIVMDRRQRALLPRIFTSGILEKVSRHAPCSVLTIDASQIIRPTPPLWRVPLLGEIT